jgi:hypothetical protein
MSFNCIPCSVEQSRQMIFITRDDDSINRFPDNTCLKCEYITLEPGEDKVFRQDLPHQGVAFNERNARLFMYWDLKSN